MGLSKKMNQIEERKVSSDRDKSLFLSKVMYSYLKELVYFSKPQKVIIWGNWDRFSYIMDDILTVNGIPHGFMEYGWLPGTYQFDRRGIGGRGQKPRFRTAKDLPEGQAPDHPAQRAGGLRPQFQFALHRV